MVVNDSCVIIIFLNLWRLVLCPRMSCAVTASPLVDGARVQYTDCAAGAEGKVDSSPLMGGTNCGTAACNIRGLTRAGAGLLEESTSFNFFF